MNSFDRDILKFLLCLIAFTVGWVIKQLQDSIVAYFKARRSKRNGIRS